jgi:tetratricopeptide (TPR) repeat protein
VQLEGPGQGPAELKIRSLPGLQTGSPLLYPEVMGETRGIATRWTCATALLLGMLCGVPALAQETADDAAAREYFERGREAFEQANYEGALIFFRHAYRLSGRPALQYNIGVAADRLQREQEALEAFQHYLEETEAPTREAEVRGRIEALEESIAEREATERALEEAAIRYQSVSQAEGPKDGRRLPHSAIIGGTVLAAVGVAGVAAMSVGLSKNGSCSSEVAGQCTVESSATAWTYVYGGLGIAALVGSATWFAIGARRAKEKRTTQISFSPTGLMVSGKF